MEGITEDIEGSVFCNAYLGWMMFLVKRVLWGNGASQVKPDQVKNILTLKFGCHGHNFTLFYKARKKLEFNIILWASNSHLLLAWGHGHLLHVLRPIHIRANCLNLFCRHVLIFIKIYRIHTVCCQYFVLSIVCLYFMLSLAKWARDYYRNWEVKDFERVYYVPWK